MTGRAERAFEVAQARTADAIIDNPIGSTLIALGVGFVAAPFFGSARAAYHAVTDPTVR